MIDPANTTGAPGQSPFLKLTSENQLSSFSPGSATRVYVRSVGAGGAVILQVGQRLIQAITSFPLRQGEWYVVQAKRTGRTIQLRVDHQVASARSPAAIAQSLGLPDDSIADAVVRAFMRSGLALNETRLRAAYNRVRRMAERKPGLVRELARLDSILVSKGLEFEEADAIGMLLSGYGRGASGGSRDQDQRGHGADGDDLEDTERAVRAAVRFSADANAPLHLFNHIVGDDDHWVIIPIRVANREISASLRLRISRAGALATGALASKPTSEGVRDAALVVEAGDDRWVFGLAPAGTGVGIDVHEMPEGANRPDFCTIGQRANGGRFDGFSSGDGADIMTSVDNSA